MSPPELDEPLEEDCAAEALAFDWADGDGLEFGAWSGTGTTVMLDESVVALTAGPVAPVGFEYITLNATAPAGSDDESV